MHNETIRDFQVQMTANGNPTTPLHHIALFTKNFPIATLENWIVKDIIKYKSTMYTKLE
jgi:hypothetical protein